MRERFWRDIVLPVTIGAALGYLIARLILIPIVHSLFDLIGVTR